MSNLKNLFKMKLLDKNKAEILIYEDIGYFGRTAKDFKNEIDSLGDVSEIDLRICSCGGEVFQGFAIYNILNQHKAKINVFIDGLAASMASMIAMVGQKAPSIAANGFFHLHNPWCGVCGESKDLRKLAELLDAMKESAIKTYSRFFKGTREELEEILNEDSIYTAEEAKELGFVSEIYDSIEIAAKNDLSKFNEQFQQKIKKGGKIMPQNLSPTDQEKKLALEKEQAEAKALEEANKEAKELEAQQKEAEELEAKNKAEKEAIELAKEEKLKAFQAFADEHGYAFAKLNFGKPEAEILKIKLEQAQKENEELRAKLSNVKPSGTKGAEPLSASVVDDGNKDINILSKISEKKARGLSAKDAWKETITEFPKEYALYIKNQKRG